MGLLNFNRNDYLNDYTYIKDVADNLYYQQHIYTLALNAKPYGWEYMCGFADYIANSDFTDVYYVGIGSGDANKDITEEFIKNGKVMGDFINFESGTLSIEGFSKTFNETIKIILINQTTVIKIHASDVNKENITKYAETAIRCTFGTENAMKLGKPCKKKLAAGALVRKIIGYIIVVFCGSALVAGTIKNNYDTVGFVVISITMVIGIILILKDNLVKIIKPYKEEVILRTKNSNTLKKIFRIFFAVGFIGMVGVVTFGYAGMEVPFMICVKVAIPSIIVFVFGLFLDVGIFDNRETYAYIKGQAIVIDSKKYMKHIQKNKTDGSFTLNGTIPLKGKSPVISLYEDGVKTREYCLQAEENEDFNKKYFVFSARLNRLGEKKVPALQLDGFISDTPTQNDMKPDNVGFRMEGHYLSCGGKDSMERYASMKGGELTVKGLKYPGYTTPSNVRLVGICSECGKSFAFHGYAFYMMSYDVAYSDDGLDVCRIMPYDIDKKTWKYEKDGKTFRYYNSFCCPHCRAPYIDYRNHPEIKEFGASGCVHVGRTFYTEE